MMDKYVCENGHKITVYQTDPPAVGESEPCDVDDCEEQMVRVE